MLLRRLSCSLFDRRGPRSRPLGIVAACALVAASPEAQAAPPPPPAQAPPQQSPKRALPDYDGREEETTAGDVLLWVPRVVFYPAYLVSEYLIRTPLGALTIAVEQNDVIDELKSIFTFGPNNNIGVVPTALIDFGFRPSVGVYFFHDDMGMPDNDLRVHAATGGSDWLRLTIADRIPIDERSHVKLRAEGWTREDWVYAGIGPRTLEAGTARYQASSVEPSVLFHLDLGDGDLFEAYGGVKTVRFGDSHDEDPTVREQVRAGLYPLPPSFATGYTAYRQGLELALDSRDPRPAPGSGVRMELAGEHAFNLQHPERSRWIRYGATFGGFIDLTGQNRVVGLNLSTTFVDPLGDDEVPFTELVALGGEEPMRGFRAGRLRGESAIAATLEYRYPIWAFLDGSAQVALGNVFSDHLSDFDFDLLRFSFTFGVRTVGSRDHSFDILIGSATETFEQGAALQSIRFLFGATRGF
jgi:hypothetical protein